MYHATLRQKKAEALYKKHNNPNAPGAGGSTRGKVLNENRDISIHKPPKKPSIPLLLSDNLIKTVYMKIQKEFKASQSQNMAQIASKSNLKLQKNGNGPVKPKHRSLFALTKSDLKHVVKKRPSQNVPPKYQSDLTRARVAERLRKEAEAGHGPLKPIQKFRHAGHMVQLVTMQKANAENLKVRSKESSSSGRPGTALLGPKKRTDYNSKFKKAAANIARSSNQRH